MYIRLAEDGDLPDLVQLEKMTFPPAERDSAPVINFRLRHFPNYFWLAETTSQKVVGAVSCRVTDKDGIDDDLYRAVPVKPGKNLAVLSLARHPQLPGQGIAQYLLRHVIRRAVRMQAENIILACKKRLVSYYRDLGFELKSRSASAWGGAVWYDMKMKLR